MASMRVDTLKSGKKRHRVRVRVNGVSCSSTHGSKSEANRWAVRQEKAAMLGKMSAEAQAKARTIADMIDKYFAEVLPHKAYNTQLSQYKQLTFWHNLLGSMTIAEVRTPVIAEGKALLAPRGNSTINSYLAALSHVYTMAIKEWEWCEVNPVKNVWRLPQDKPRTRFLSTIERSRLLFYCRISSCKALLPIVVVTLSTGPRKSEIRRVKLADYVPERSEIYLNETKNGERRAVRLFGMAAELMREIWQTRRPGQVYFFPSPQDWRRPIDFRYSWEKSLELAQIENFCFHDLRHSAASYLAWQGATLQDIQEILGHKDIATTRKYTHVTKSRTDPLLQAVSQVYL